MPLRTLASRLVAAAALVVVVLALGATRLAPVASGQEDGMGQVAGSWVWTHHFGPMGSMRSLVTFGKEGTVVGASGGMFGNPLGPTPEERAAKEGPLHGVWERDGAAGIRGVVIMARYDSSGMMVGFSRARTVVQLVDRDHMEGTSSLEVLGGCSAPPAGPLGCPDPTDPDAAWVPFPMMPPSGFVVTGTRIHVPMP
jgi:hypothetical protein